MSGAAEATQDAKAVLADMLWNHPDPEISGGFREIIAKASPQAKRAMPEIIAREETGKALSEVRAEREAYRKERAEDEARRATEARRKRLTDGFTGPDGSVVRIAPEDVAKVEDLMREEGIANPEIAAFAFAARTKVAAPRASYSPTAEIPGRAGAGGDDFKGIMENPDQWARNRASQIWDDLKNGRGQQWLD